MQRKLRDPDQQNTGEDTVDIGRARSEIRAFRQPMTRLPVGTRHVPQEDISMLFFIDDVFCTNHIVVLVKFISSVMHALVLVTLMLRFPD